MGVTQRKLKSGRIVYLAQKRVNEKRVSKVFDKKHEAYDFLAIQERIASGGSGELTKYHKMSKDKLKEIEEDSRRYHSKTIQEILDNKVNLFHKNHWKMKDSDFVYYYNIISSWERTTEQLLRYKSIIRKKEEDLVNAN